MLNSVLFANHIIAPLAQGSHQCLDSHHTWCLRASYVPPTERGGGGGDIVFGADRVGVRVASFPHVIF